MHLLLELNRKQFFHHQLAIGSAIRPAGRRHLGSLRVRNTRSFLAKAACRRSPDNVMVGERFLA
jgi:hypothetical protein